MTTIEKLNALIKMCKGSISIDINPHRDNYDSIQEYLLRCEIDEDPEYKFSLNNPDLYLQILEKNQLIDISAYPNAPVGFYTFYHYDFEQAIDKAYNKIKQIKDNTKDE